MTTLLHELSNLEDNKKYSIVLNGIGCFMFATTENLRLSKIEDNFKELLDFELQNKKERGKYYVLEFSGKTDLKQNEIVQFLLNIINYNKKKFNPTFLTIAIEKRKGEKPILVAVDMKKTFNGEIIRQDLKNHTNSGMVSILGDYYFENYLQYQGTLQSLVDIWVNE